MKKHESRLSRDILLEQMRRLACAKVNDAVKLAYLPEEERESIGRLDLAALTEFRRSGAGTVELKFTDRMKALERLLELSGPSGEEQLEQLFPADGGPGGVTPLVFSPKQRRVLTWWRPGSTDCGHQALICGGAVRSGKTLCAGLSFLCWATLTFQGRRFALCGKTIQSVRRNLWSEVQPVLRALGFSWTERLSRGQITLRLGERENTFLLFGGSDERAAGLIQGVTLAGALLDEAVLMPRSFVEQVCARCSVEGSRLWFTCNPESPGHWFYQEWIRKAEEKGALHLTFTMADNPGCPRRYWPDIRPCFGGPSTGGSCWANGRRRRGWSMTFSAPNWYSRSRRVWMGRGTSPVTMGR